MALTGRAPALPRCRLGASTLAAGVETAAVFPPWVSTQFRRRRPVPASAGSIKPLAVTGRFPRFMALLASVCEQPSSFANARTDTGSAIVKHLSAFIAGVGSRRSPPYRPGQRRSQKKLHQFTKRKPINGQFLLMTSQINLDILPNATVVIIDPISGAGPQKRDAREVLLAATRAAKTQPIQRGNNGTRYDVQLRDDSAEMLWKLAGGIELERCFATQKS